VREQLRRQQRGIVALVLLLAGGLHQAPDVGDDGRGSAVVELLQLDELGVESVHVGAIVDGRAAGLRERKAAASLLIHAVVLLGGGDGIENVVAVVSAGQVDAHQRLVGLVVAGVDGVGRHLAELAEQGGAARHAEGGLDEIASGSNQHGSFLLGVVGA
jgi:hypothetical protein